MTKEVSVGSSVRTFFFFKIEGSEPIICNYCGSCPEFMDSYELNQLTRVGEE